MLTQRLKHLLSFCFKCFASEKVKEKAHECKCSVHTLQLVAKLHLDPHKIKSKLRSLSVTSFYSLHVLQRLQGPMGPSLLLSMQKSMKDFYPRALINMHLLHGWARQSYWVKWWVISEFSNKTRKTSCINKSMKHGRLIEQPAVAGWAEQAVSLLIQLLSDLLTLERLLISYTHTHTIKHLAAAGWSVCSTCVLLRIQRFFFVTLSHVGAQTEWGVYP